MALARIGLGSNVGDSVATVENAIRLLGRLGSVVVRSSLYRTPAWGVRMQADFINAAALLETPLAPRELMGALQALERELGRVRTYHWGPRVIDLDILAYDDLAIDEPDLKIPHERLRSRAFALVPLSEIEPVFGLHLALLAPEERDAVQRIQAAPARTTRAVDWDETIERARAAAAFCAAAGLTRFRVEHDDLEVEVKRSARFVPLSLVAPAGDAVATTNGVHTGTNGSAVPPTKPRSVLKAEFVGIVRLSRPSVSPGSVLGEDRELAFVEALGIRNPVRSGGPGRVAEVYVTDGQAVEYGQALFSIEA